MWHAFGFTPSWATLIDVVEAIVGTDAVANGMLPVLNQLLHQMRIGHVPRHANHVDRAGCDGMPRRGDIRDMGGMERRKVNRATNFSCQIQMWSRSHAQDQDEVDQAGIGIDMATAINCRP